MTLDYTPSSRTTARFGKSARHGRGNPLRAWAQAYARHGWAVFPLASGTKVPALSRRNGGHGCSDATTDPRIVDRMWTRFPDANIGIATGEVSGLAVLDVDPAHGGNETLTRLTAAHGPLDVGPATRTPSGGQHFLFTWRPGLSCSQSRLGPGLDVRGTGGYIVAAPSTTPVGAYTWIVPADAPLPYWPAWLVPAQSEPARPLVATGTPVNPDAALAGLARTVATAPEGTRNGRLYWASCRLAEHAAAGRIPVEDGAAVLLAAAGEAGLGEDEAQRTLASGLRNR